MANRQFSLSNYPLSWPADWKRTPNSHIKNGKFLRNHQMPSIMEGLNRVIRELSMMGIAKDDVLVSTNVPTRLDGMPRSDQREPQDSGVAVYWRKSQNGQMRCIAIDIYSRVADNLCAVAATLEAMRAIERHGGAQVQERTFRGFVALASTTEKPWRDVLGFAEGKPISLADVETRFREPWRDVLGFAEGKPISLADVETRFRELAMTEHPDKGGTTAGFQEIEAARRNARIELTN